MSRMAMLTSTDAAKYLSVSRRSLFRHREALAERGLAKWVGRRWMFTHSPDLKLAWLELAHYQAGNAATLDRLAAEVKDGSRDEYAAKTQQFWEEFGRWAPGEVQTEGQYWRHVAEIAVAMMGGDLPPERVEVLAQQLSWAAEDADLGARWDASKWAAASARLEAEE